MALKFNPLTGEFDLTGSSSGGTTSDANFSYETVAVAQTVTVPENQQMIVHQQHVVKGTLIINGRLVIIGEQP